MQLDPLVADTNGRTRGGRSWGPLVIECYRLEYACSLLAQYPRNRRWASVLDAVGCEKAY